MDQPIKVRTPVIAAAAPARNDRTATNLGKALEILPEGKKEFLIGYAEGVAAMAAKQADSQPGDKGA